MSEYVFTNKEQLCQSFWQSQKFKAKKIEGVNLTSVKASRVNLVQHNWYMTSSLRHYDVIAVKVLNYYKNFANQRHFWNKIKQNDKWLYWLLNYNTKPQTSKGGVKWIPYRFFGPKIWCYQVIKMILSVPVVW